MSPNWEVLWRRIPQCCNWLQRTSTIFHPHSLVSKLTPIHCCTWWNTLRECCFAAADVGGRHANSNFAVTGNRFLISSVPQHIQTVISGSTVCCDSKIFPCRSNFISARRWVVKYCNSFTQFVVFSELLKESINSNLYGADVVSHPVMAWKKEYDI